MCVVGKKELIKPAVRVTGPHCEFTTVRWIGLVAGKHKSKHGPASFVTCIWRRRRHHQCSSTSVHLQDDCRCSCCKSLTVHSTDTAIGGTVGFQVQAPVVGVSSDERIHCSDRPLIAIRLGLLIAFAEATPPIPETLETSCCRCCCRRLRCH